MKTICAAALILLTGLGGCAAETFPSNVAQNLPSGDHAFQLTIKKEVLQKQLSTVRVFSLPQLRIYNRDRRQIYDFGDDFDAASFQQKLAAALQNPQIDKSGKTLDWEAGRIANLPANQNIAGTDFTFVEYWATWCKPCAIQGKLLHEFFKSHPQWRINLWHVEADPTKNSPAFHIRI